MDTPDMTRTISSLAKLLDIPERLLDPGEHDADAEGIEIRGQRFFLRNGILRAEELYSDAQRQTAEAFGFKWNRPEEYDSPAALRRARIWLEQRYGRVEQDMAWLLDESASRVLLDAGCGSGMSALELFGENLNRFQYVGADISDAIDMAAARFAQRGMPGEFIQSDLMSLPFPENSFDAIFSEGVLHHTDSTEQALYRLSRLLKPGGRFMFYVYRKKGPVREFTDDYIREKVQQMTPQEALEAMMPLTKLGRLLGELQIKVNVPESIDLLEIPAGEIDLQRLFYWHVCKAFYHPDLSIEEENLINFDWYAPRNAHRQTIEEVRDWCGNAGLVIERERVEDAGITVIARKKGG